LAVFRDTIRDILVACITQNTSAFDYILQEISQLTGKTNEIHILLFV